ncbi:MAG: hypothetical protein DRP74_00785 [Candidatus Omnitrophota bacterium]|nr:MAG: hypothetical protein DRP74_00785 [Candidatus Omnitrophota bacterium]
MKDLKPIIIIVFFLLGVAIFTIFKYLDSTREKHVLLNKLKQAQTRISDLSKGNELLLQDLFEEKKSLEKLRRENTDLARQIETKEKEVARLRAASLQTKESIEELNYRIALLKEENLALREEKRKIILGLSKAPGKEEEIANYLVSIKELRRVIKDLEKKIRQAKKELRKERLTREVKIEKDQKISGNRGFLTWQGKNTTSTKVNIEVIPASEYKGRQ